MKAENALAQLRSHLEAGQPEKAEQILESMLGSAERDVMVHFQLASLRASLGKHEAAVHNYRSILKLGSAEERRLARFQLSRSLRYAKGKAELRDLSDLESVRPKIAIFGPPHSGVETLGDGLAEALGMASGEAADLQLGHEPELSLFRLESIAMQPAVIRQCARCTEPNLQLLQVFAPKPMFILRPLEASLESEVQFLRANGTPLDRAVEWAARRSAIWAIDQAASFIDALRMGRLDVLVLAYAELQHRPQEAVARIARHLDLDLPPLSLSWPASSPKLNWDNHRERWRRYAGVFQDLDLGGLELPARTVSSRPQVSDLH